MTPKEQIVSALRSGEYKQTRRQLKSGDNFCILGVICDVYMKGKDGGGVQWESMLLPGGDEVLYPEGLSESNDEFEYQLLPPEIAEWAFGSRDDVSPIVWVDGTQRTVSSLNDAGLCTFERFADLFEKQL